MATVLLYNIEPKKEIKIKNLCRKLYFGFRTVEKEEFGYRLSYLLELSDDDTIGEGEDFSEEMLYLSGIDSGMLNIFLSQLRLKDVPVVLKAVMTETNLGFNSYELYHELKAEREAIEKGKTAHT